MRPPPSNPLVKPPRRALAGDAAAIAAVTRRAYGKWVELIGAEPQPMGADYAAIVAADQVWVDGVAGIAALLVLRIMPDHFLIWSVAVDPSLQGSGLGKTLLGLAEAEALRQGYDEIRLYTNIRFAANRALYAKLSYVETHLEDLNGRTAVHMKKSLRA
jgi:ribosomal protein S18 acetylase RimI-like enzyme